MRKSEMAVTFHVRPYSLTKNGEGTIIMSVWFGEKDRAKVDLGWYTSPKDWNHTTQRVNESAPNASELNRFMDFMKIRINRIYEKLASEENIQLTSSLLVEHLMLENTSNEIWEEVDPETNMIISYRCPKNGYLELFELNRILQQEIDDEKIQIARDLFLLCCLTGGRFCDIEPLSQRDIKVSDGNNIKYVSVGCRDIAISPIVDGIIGKYVDHLYCKKTTRLLPKLFNKDLSPSMRKLAEICGVDKRLIQNLAARTFFLYGHYNFKLYKISDNPILKHFEAYRDLSYSCFLYKVKNMPRP